MHHIYSTRVWHVCIRTYLYKPMAIDMTPDGNPEHTQLVAAWLEDQPLKLKAESGIMSQTYRKGVATRLDVVANYETLAPIISILGPKVQIDILMEHCREFLWKTRPRGKPELSRTSGLF